MRTPFSQIKRFDAVCVDCKNDRQEYLAAIERENAKLKQKYAFLYNKYETICKNVERNDNQHDVDVCELPELDLSMSVAFVVGNEITFHNNLLETFPNAKLLSGNQEFVLRNIDCVVAITSCIDHAVYYRIKDKCKSLGVPFVHCQHSNVELIKQLILNALY